MVTCLVFGGIAGFLAIVVARERAAKTEVLSIAATILGGEYSVPDGTASGKKLGPRVVLTYAMRGSGSSAQAWTEIAVDLPRGCPLAIHVRRHGWRDQRKIERGEMIDVQVGDLAFDSAFLVEAAPSDVAVRLLDAPTRDFLDGYADVELSDRGAGSDRSLVFATKTWLRKPEQLRRALEGAAGIGRSVSAAFAAADQAIAPVDTGSPYRPQLDDHAARDGRARRAEEIQTLGALREQRAAGQQLSASIALIVMAIVFVVALAYAISAATAR